MASERIEQLRTLVLLACEDLGTHGLQTTPDAIAAVSALIVNASRLGAEVDAAAEIARLTRELEAAREILRDLADDEDAGIVWTGTRVVCAYCYATDRYDVEHNG